MTEIAPVSIQLRSIPFRILTDRSLRPVRHLILVVAILTISISQNMSYYATTAGMPVSGIYGLSLITAIVYLAVAYLHIYVLVPRFLAKKDYASYFFTSLASLLLLWGVRMAQNQIAVNLWQIGIRPFGIPAVLDAVSDLALNLLCFTGVSLTVLLKYWLQEESRISELESNRLSVELETIRNSVDPNMLLGTLHTCGTDAIDNPDKSAGMILKLSELLRYQLYESGKEKVFLTSEIAFIRNYLELEKQRTGNLDYSVTVEGSPLVYVAPLLFMPVIKAALATTDRDKEIRIHIDNSPSGISFRCNALFGMSGEQISDALKAIKLLYGKKAQIRPNGTDEFLIRISHE